MEPNYGTVARPDHVQPERVVDFDFLRPEGVDHQDVYSIWSKLHAGPDIVWTPRNGGHWIFTRAEDIRFVQEHFDPFSHEEFALPRGTHKIKMPPLAVDPPGHARFRAMLNPFFTPSRVRIMEEQARPLTIQLIEAMKPRGGCEFVSEFARVMPVMMFLGIVDLPTDRRDEFVGWALSAMTAPDQATKDHYYGKVTAYLAGILDERATSPGTDLLSRIVGWRKDPRYEGEHEVMGMALLVFFGGLDTVANMLSFTARHLAQHPEHRHRIIADPSIAPVAAEEYIRRHGLPNTARVVTRDVDYKNVTFKKDDMVLVSTTLSSLDERCYPHAAAVDFDREPQPHNTFGNGPHKCVGAPLARVELMIFLQEWLSRIPEFRLDPDHKPHTHSGRVLGVESLHLRWD